MANLRTFSEPTIPTVTSAITFIDSPYSYIFPAELPVRSPSAVSASQMKKAGLVSAGRRPGRPGD